MRAAETLVVVDDTATALGTVVGAGCATPWGTLAFTPPLRAVLNPVIFADQVQTGDVSRWSNPGPRAVRPDGAAR